MRYGTSTGSPPSLTVGLARMRAAFGESSTAGIAPGVVVPASTGWFSAAELVDGDRLAELTAGPARRWQASPHAAASLAWKAYCYWLGLPVVTAWVVGAPVPDVTPARVLVRLLNTSPFLQIALAPMEPTDESASLGTQRSRFAVLPAGATAARVRATMLKRHLEPIAERLLCGSRVSRRTLSGELAYGLACIHARAATLAPCPTLTAAQMLDGLGLREFVHLPDEVGSGHRARRLTCCLALAVPALNRICADCVASPTSPAASASSNTGPRTTTLGATASRQASTQFQGENRHA